jgi:transcriptional regulator with XRE-family HTH domain
VPYFRDEKLIVVFGKNLRKLREMKGISQEELAHISDLDLTQIGRIERGVTNTSISIANKLAKSLKIPLKDLFDL